MIFLGVLSTEQSFLTPEETIRCVLIAAHMEQSRWYETSFSDVTPCGSHRLVFAGFQVVHGNVSQNTLTSQTTTADALALLGHEGSGTGEKLMVNSQSDPVRQIAANGTSPDIRPTKIVGCRPRQNGRSELRPFERSPNPNRCRGDTQQKMLQPLL